VRQKQALGLGHAVLQARDKAGMLQATVDFALKRSDLGPGLREHLKQIRL
jgi:UTP-glucose-1-phosphate uridylyltransferase